MKQMQHVRAEIVPLIKDVCQRLVGHAIENEVRLLLGTAAAESGLIFRKQLDGGPARGLWQMEPATARDIFQNYLKSRLATRYRLFRIWLELSMDDFFLPDRECLAFHLERLDDFACAMARIKYLRDPDAIPDDLEGQAKYWYKVYQTPGGAHKPEWYIKQWQDCGCKELLIT